MARHGFFLSSYGWLLYFSAHKVFNLEQVLLYNQEKKKFSTVDTNLKNFMLMTVDKNKKGSQLWTENLSVNQQVSIKCYSLYEVQ